RYSTTTSLLNFSRRAPIISYCTTIQNGYSMYKISDIESINGDNDYGMVIIWLKGAKKPIECNSMDFDHVNGTFSTNGELTTH
ncbi:MAG TPA: hypothetical protein VEA58_04095, partial [Anaerovoracaceae bacterium]|nr:hypothetical protein [Anaerovoracaceae bacterium]